MKKSLIFLLVLATHVSLSQQQVSRCLLSRLDYIPCKYQHRKIDRASLNNDYSIHYTRLRQSGSGAIECNVRFMKQDVRSISDLDTDDMKIIYSPGFLHKVPYDNRLLVQYNIQCREGQLAFFNLSSLDLQGDNECLDDGKPKCQDYILIDRGVGGTTEICGNSVPKDSLMELQPRNFTVFFRTSETEKFTGFEMYIICFQPEERNQTGCLLPSDFNSSVCNAGSGYEKTPVTNVDGRRKRDAYVDGMTYKDIFPHYPSGLRIREDVANFHSQWHRQKRQSELGIRFISRIVLFNETVNYTENTIFITDSDNVETDKYTGVLVLQTFDAEGKVSNYVGDVNSMNNPHFFGPGPLVILWRYAYFQLFLIDPRGLIPTPEEEQDLIALNRQLLDAVPQSDDVPLNDTDPPPTEDFSFLDFDGRRKRHLAEDEDVDELQQQEDIDEDIVFLALRNLEACNPVLRSQARLNIQFYRSKNDTRKFLECLLNFTMTCLLRGKQLNCTVDEGFAPALDKGTYCTINNQTATRQECEPFYEPALDLQTMDSIMSVTVEAINCNGQRAMVIVHQEVD